MKSCTRRRPRLTLHVPTAVHLRPPPTDPGSLRRFAVQLGAILLVLLAVLAWRMAVPLPGISTAATILLLGVVAGLIWPPLVRPVQAGSFAFSRWMGRYAGGLALMVFFFLAITPLGWLLRRFGHDPLGLRTRPGQKSFWHKASPPGPLDRMY